MSYQQKAGQHDGWRDIMVEDEKSMEADMNDHPGKPPHEDDL